MTKEKVDFVFQSDCPAKIKGVFIRNDNYPLRLNLASNITYEPSIIVNSKEKLIIKRLSHNEVEATIKLGNKILRKSKHKVIIKNQ